MWVFETAFAATPWALRGLIVVAVLAVALAIPVSRRSDCRPVVGCLLIFGISAPLVITLTPSAGILETGVGAAGARFCSLLPPTALLATHTDVLNVAMLMPLGTAAALLSTRRQLVAILAVAVALPPVIETLQYVAHPLLGRSCQAGDVVHNWLGVTVSLAVAGAARAMWKLRSDRSDRRTAAV